jgi:hypothetical protein
LEHYEIERLSVVAPRAIRHYEENVFPLTQLTNALAHRLSVPGWPAAEIAPLFEEIAAEASKRNNYRQRLGAATPNGNLDPTFGTGGTVVNSVLAGTDGLDGAVIQADGNIITVGTASNSTELTLARYLGN